MHNRTYHFSRESAGSPTQPAAGQVALDPVCPDVSGMPRSYRGIYRGGDESPNYRALTVQLRKS